MRTGEKLIPKAVLLRALHEIMAIARAPGDFAARHVGSAAQVDEHAFCLGYIEGVARDALAAAPPTEGWLAGKAGA